MRQIQEVVMIALIVSVSDRFGRTTGRAIGANVGIVPGGVSPRGRPYGTIATPNYFYYPYY